MPSPSPHDVDDAAATARLGALTAGIAHDLATPTAALSRAADTLGTDLDALLGALAGTADDPASSPAARARLALARARDAAPRTTAQDRALRRAIAERLGDDALARRLVVAGCADVEEALELSAAGADAVELSALATSVGAALGRLDVAARQVTTLTGAVRSYVRGSSARAAPAEVDVAAGLRDALTLTAHRLRGMAVTTSLEEVPPVLARPGSLDQVWTNVLVNAAEATGGTGRLTITLSRADEDGVRVVLANDGPPIPPADLERIFAPRVSTKDHSTGSGLGLGLALCREIVGEAGGTMHARSKAGLTEMIVELPIAGGTKAAEETAGKERT